MNRITVYERRDSPVLYMEWWDDEGRHKEALKVNGNPVTDRELAERIGRSAAASQAKKRNASVERFLFPDSAEQRSLGQLLALYHGVNSWEGQHGRDQERYRKLWLELVGEATPLKDVTPLVVRMKAAQVAEAREWSPRSHGAFLRYLKSAFRFAQLEAKWIQEAGNLSAVRIPPAKGRSLAYSHEEALRLLAATSELDPRLAWTAHAIYQTGRRLTAVLSLRLGDVLEEGVTENGVPWALIRWEASKDKARRAGTSYVAGPAVEILDVLRDQAAVQATGLLTPEGDLHSRSPRGATRGGRSRKRGPVSRETVVAWWREELEPAAGVPHLDGRASHGLKRRWATDTHGKPGRDQVAGTREETLVTVYRQDDQLEAKLAVALAQAAALDTEAQ